MKKIIVFLMIAFLLVGCGSSGDSVDEMSNTIDKVYTIEDAKEAANLRSVEAYAKAIEYGVIQYEYKNNGDLPKSYCDVKQYISYTNEEVVCDVEIDDDSANVSVSHCKVGSYEKHSYRYDGTLRTEDRGAEVEDETEFGYPESCY